MSSISTGNDEVLLSFYSIDSIPKLIESYYYIFQSRESTYSFSFDKKPSDRVLCILIEHDSENTVDTMIQNLSLNIKDAIIAYDHKDYIEIENVIGDEDLLGYKELDLQIVDSVKFRGIHKLDKYEYILRWSD